MKKIEALTLELAYTNAATLFECSVTELDIEVIQVPCNGFFGLFKKSAIIVAMKRQQTLNQEEVPAPKEVSIAPKKEPKEPKEPKEQKEPKEPKEQKEQKEQKEPKEQKKQKEPKEPKEQQEQKQKVEKQQNQPLLNDTDIPLSFVSSQDDEVEKTHKQVQKSSSKSTDISSIASEVEEKINKLFKHICFSMYKIEVSVYDSETILVDFQGHDVALLIGKDGYRYKALLYMISNWINYTYDVQLRLEVAEFLNNQEEAVACYLNSIYESIDSEGCGQTKILDGILLEIALKELRKKYTNKYVAVRTVRGGSKYILISDYYH